MNILLLMMGGSGTRFGAAIPKQYVTVHGHPIFYYIIREYLKCREIHAVVLVSHENWISYVNEQMKTLSPAIPYRIVRGGATRSESVLNGLNEAVTLGYENDIVLIHDATHPYVDKPNLEAVIEAVKLFGGATLGGCQYDTVYQTDEAGVIKTVLPRQQVFSGASPEAFHLGELRSIYQNADRDELEIMTSAGALALAHGIPMKVIPTNLLNLKITHPEDMELFTHLADKYFFSE